MATEKSNDQFEKDVMKARMYVSAELRKYDVDIDVQLLATISAMQSVALKFIDGSISGEETRSSFDSVIAMYANSNNLPL